MASEFDRAKIEADMIELARQLMAHVPDKIAPLLAASSSQAECEKIIEAAIVEALAGLETAVPGRWN